MQQQKVSEHKQELQLHIPHEEVLAPPLLQRLVPVQSESETHNGAESAEIVLRIF